MQGIMEGFTITNLECTFELPGTVTVSFQLRHMLNSASVRHVAQPKMRWLVDHRNLPQSVWLPQLLQSPDMHERVVDLWNACAHAS